MSNFLGWDLVIDRNIKIVQRWGNKILEGSFKPLFKPSSNQMHIEISIPAIGKNLFGPKVEKEMVITLPSKKQALLAYERFSKQTQLERAIQLTKILEKEGPFNVNKRISENSKTPARDMVLEDLKKRFLYRI